MLSTRRMALHTVGQVLWRDSFFAMLLFDLGLHMFVATIASVLSVSSRMAGLTRNFSFTLMI